MLKLEVSRYIYIHTHMDFMYNIHTYIYIYVGICVSFEFLYSEEFFFKEWVGDSAVHAKSDSAVHAKTISVNAERASLYTRKGPHTQDVTQPYTWLKTYVVTTCWMTTCNVGSSLALGNILDATV
jgi:hypothetical protein